ncbi:hypothetical protein [uncultured Rhodoferax sp.]|uniref:hypothetical protein n=1 Tax=uncultured Rhodoferax sp. TaxID=223188 RepID=UPI0025D3A021|nr:hypothetical protein [uncultured Rhodoferax sp.]
MRLLPHVTLLRQHPENDNQILDFFHPDNPGCLRELLAFSINDAGAENVLALMACRDYAKAPTWEKLRYINATFVDQDSTFEVNYPSAVRESLRLLSSFNLGALQYKSSGSGRSTIKPVSRASLPPDANYFLKAKLTDTIEDNLVDTYSRFTLPAANFQKKLNQIWIGRIAINPARSAIRTQVVRALVDMRSIGFHISKKLNEL